VDLSNCTLKQAGGTEGYEHAQIRYRWMYLTAPLLLVPCMT